MGNQIANTGPRVRHFVNQGITIAYQPLNNGTVDVAYALTHHNDQYDRRVGRQIALGRLNSNKDIPQRINVNMTDPSAFDDGRVLEKNLLGRVIENRTKHAGVARHLLISQS